MELETCLRGSNLLLICCHRKYQLFLLLLSLGWYLNLVNPLSDGEGLAAPPQEPHPQLSAFSIVVIYCGLTVTASKYQL